MPRLPLLIKRGPYLSTMNTLSGGSLSLLPAMWHKKRLPDYGQGSFVLDTTVEIPRILSVFVMAMASKAIGRSMNGRRRVNGRFWFLVLTFGVRKASVFCSF